jgi:hypothetical protein
LYILDESSDILHLEKNNHPFLINNIVSLNQNPPSPMVAAVRSKELLVISDVETHKTPNIAPLVCHGRVVGALNISDKEDGGAFTRHDIAAVELFRQLIGASIGNVSLFGS